MCIISQSCVCKYFAITAGLLLLVGRVAPAPAAENLRLELAEVAKDIKKLLDARKDTAIAIGAFAGPAHFDSSAGPAIA